MQNVSILGSTGTIGQQTLDVIVRHSEKYRVFALTANSNVEALLKQCLTHHPFFAVLLNEKASKELSGRLKL